MESTSTCMTQDAGCSARLSAGTIRTILVPVSGSETDRVVLSAAWTVAEPLKAHLEFLHLRLKLEVAASRSQQASIGRDPAIRDALGHLALEQANVSASAGNYVRHFCRDHGIALSDKHSGVDSVSADWLEENEADPARLLFHARHSDLTVLGRAQHPDCMPANVIEQVLAESGHPLLIVPRRVPRPLLETIVVGWKESAASARAIVAALPLLQLARRVVIVNVVEANSPGLDALYSVSRQLAWHGVTAEILRLGDSIATAEELLPATVTDLKAGLLVIGGYGHSRRRETVFGGVTRSLVRGADIPLFIVH